MSKDLAATGDQDRKECLMAPDQEYATAEEIGVVLGKFGFGIRTSGKQETLAKWDENEVPGVYLVNASEVVGKDLPEIDDAFHKAVVETCREATLSNRRLGSSKRFGNRARAAISEMTDNDIQELLAEYMSSGE